jgi:hypothetical protein
MLASMPPATEVSQQAMRAVLRLSDLGEVPSATEGAAIRACVA